MIIRRLGSSLHLITQPQHAALAARIMREWHVDHFPESPRKASILMAVEHHDDGWDDADASLVVDEASGRLLDFMEVSDTLKRESRLLGLKGSPQTRTPPRWLRNIDSMSATTFLQPLRRRTHYLHPRRL